MTDRMMVARTYERFPRPSFANGFARALDLFGGFRQRRVLDSSKAADARALASDWEKVGRDLQRAFDRAGCR